jgi:hypothetical protein
MEHPHASTSAGATAPGHLAADPGWPGSRRHRRGPRPRAADRPPSRRSPPSDGPRRGGSRLRPLRGGDAQAGRIRRASRRRPAAGASDLGGRIDPRDPGPPPPRRPAAVGPHPAALAPPRRAGPRAGGATSVRRLTTGREASRSLADGRGRVGEAPDRTAHLLVADRRRVQRRRAPDRGFPPEAAGTRSRPRKPRRSSVWPSAAGAGPSDSGSTMARPGARGATCRPIWRCG